MNGVVGLTMSAMPALFKSWAFVAWLVVLASSPRGCLGSPPLQVLGALAHLPGREGQEHFRFSGRHNTTEATPWLAATGQESSGSGAVVGGGPCHPETVWRTQGWANLSNALGRCGTRRTCGQSQLLCQSHCSTDKECAGFPMRLCDSKSFRCRHKHLFEGAAEADILVALMFFVVSGLALSAGIGGGGLYVPLLVITLNFSVQEATALSQSCLAGGAASTLVYNMQRRHPFGRKPLIDYNLVLIMGPFLLIGALCGSTLNASAPSWLILLLLALILCQSLWKTTAKALETWRREQQQRNRELVLSASQVQPSGPGPSLPQPASCASQQHCHDAEAGPRPSVAGTVQPTTAGEQVPSSGATPAVATLGPFVQGRVSSCGADMSAATSSKGSEEAQAMGSPRERQGAEPPREQWGVEQAQSPAQSPAQNPARDLAANADATSGAGVEVAMEGGSSCDSDPRPSRPSETPEQPQYPACHLVSLGLMWTVLVGSIFTRGGRAAAGLVPYCSLPYWMMAAATIVVLAVIGGAAAARAVAETARFEATALPPQAGTSFCSSVKVNLGRTRSTLQASELELGAAAVASTTFEREEQGEGEEEVVVEDLGFEWTASAARYVAIWSVIAGTLAALCGIGGGMVMGPKLLDLGCLPQVVSATTATTLFIMSSSTALFFLVQGAAPADYTLFLALTAASGALLGTALIGWVVKRYRRPSLLMFLLAAIIAASLLVMVITGVIDVVNDVRHGANMLFRSLCQEEDG